jgi:serine/threonine protein kinase
VTDGETGGAPPFVEQATPAGPLPLHLIGFPRAGQTLGDFELLRVLGSGAFACVFLARQKSLGRQVALKVSRNRGQEAEMLARMEHGHIVRVFSEAVDLERDLHLLCMQYVPGTTLEDILAYLRGLPPEERGGQAILDFLDSRPGDAPALDLDSLRQRERLAGMDHTEAVCWMGARLAEALAHAHALGILHRDIKPANILVNRYGQPLLADFNVSRSLGPNEEGGLGGTLAYMAPEHLEAFLRRKGTFPPGESADLYSLGVLLYQLYTGHLPFQASASGTATQALEELIKERQLPPPNLSRRMPASPGLERLMARCLAPAPADRFENAAGLAAALDSERELHRAHCALPRGNVLTRFAADSPRWYVLLFVLVHLLATVVNITYNELHIVGKLEPVHTWWFFWVCIPVYNAVAWPVCLWLFLRPVMRVFTALGQIQQPGPVDVEQINAARREALTLPWHLAIFSCLGWLPGGLLFPLALSLIEPLPLSTYLQFVFSFTVSGLIAIVYSVLLMELLVLRSLYPALWADARGLRFAAREELEQAEWALPRLQLLAVLVPVAGAGLLLSVPVEDKFPWEFRLLILVLLAAGMLGLGLAMVVTAELRRVVTILTGLTRDESTGKPSRPRLSGGKGVWPPTDPPRPNPR